MLGVVTVQLPQVPGVYYGKENACKYSKTFDSAEYYA